MLPGTLRAFRFNLISLALFALSCWAPRTLSSRSSWRARVASLLAWLTGSAGLLAARSSVICGMCNNLNYAHESENCQPGKTDKQQPRVQRASPGPKCCEVCNAFRDLQLVLPNALQSVPAAGEWKGVQRGYKYILKFRREI